MLGRLRKEETSVGEWQDARSTEGGANREMGAGSKMERGRKTEKKIGWKSKKRRGLRKRVRDLGKGGIKREG